MTLEKFIVTFILLASVAFVAITLARITNRSHSPGIRYRIPTATHFSGREPRKDSRRNSENHVGANRGRKKSRADSGADTECTEPIPRPTSTYIVHPAIYLYRPRRVRPRNW